MGLGQGLSAARAGRWKCGAADGKSYELRSVLDLGRVVLADEEED